jgi:hypothetical protein
MRTILWLSALVGCGGGTTAKPSTPVSNQPPPVTLSQAPAQPECTDMGAKCVISQFEHFTNRMCACSDKSCADATNNAMTKWGTDVAKRSGEQEKPDVDMAKKAADLMTRYTECMTKVMVKDGGTAPPPPPDPCGGGGDPCGDPCGG